MQHQVCLALLTVLSSVFHLSAAPSPAPAERPWTLARSPHFEVYSQSGPEAARAALLWFEDLRIFFQHQTTLSPTPPARLRVIGFASPKDYAAYQLRESPSADAYYVGFGQQHTIVLPGLASRQMETAAHEYVHALLHTRSGGNAALPTWLSEGLADVYSTVQAGPKASTVGTAPPGRLALLQRRGPLPLAELLGATSNTFQQSGRETAALYYASSWALTHLLLFSPDYRASFPALLTALGSGEPAATALPRLTGRSLAAVTRDLNGWIARQDRFPGMPLPPLRNEPSSQPPAAVEIQPVTPVAAKIVLADLLLTLGELPRATDLYTAIARQEPNNPHIPAALGTIALKRNEPKRARELWHTALTLGLDDPALCFHYAVLAQEAAEPAEQIRPALERAVALAPDFDDARYQLALLEKNTGHESAAVAHLRALRTIAPSRAYSYWTSLADAYLTLDQRDDAKSAARVAEPFARTADEQSRIHDLFYLADTDLSVRVARDPLTGIVRAVTTRVPHAAPPPNPFIEPGDQVRKVEAALTEIRCGDENETRLLLNTASGSPLELAIADPARVLMRNAPPDFTCGPQAAPPTVTVVYAATGPATGLVRGVEFPAPPPPAVQ